MTTYLYELVSTNKSKRIAYGSCKRTTGNIYCDMYSLGLSYIYIVKSLNNEGEYTLREGINIINNIPFSNTNLHKS